MPDLDDLVAKPDFIDELFPLQAKDRHIRRVLNHAEVPPGLEYAMRAAPIFYKRILSHEESNCDVFFEEVVIPPWQQYTGTLGDPDSWHNGLGEPIEWIDGKWHVKEHSDA